MLPSDAELVTFVAPRVQMGIMSVALDRVADMIAMSEPFREADVEADDLRDLASALRPLAGWSPDPEGEEG